ncbi:hypothetical protein [uncultured Thermanaerothrix sp.]|uniref:hypothetical protein n=1 Tax=uncultured Thermanaerothrix sp. TaxID=1195149 RepID=UPI002610CE18|nr:hypothetical protein [uncultured Thermanaerothrix sp.]
MYPEAEFDACGCGGQCGCSGEHGAMIALTREEYIQRLEAYLRELRAEIEAVERELTELRQIA